MLILEVLIEYTKLALNRPFSYAYKGKKKIDKGYRVLLNFNHREIVGYVVDVKETSESIEEIENRLGFKIEEIIGVIDEAPLLNEELLSLADQISDYYLAPKISVLQTMLPPSMSPRKSSLKAPKIAYDQYLIIKENNEEGLTYKQIEILRLIASEGRILKREIKNVSIVKKLIELGRIEILFEEKRRLSIPDYEKQKQVILTDEQSQVLSEIINTQDNVYLLEGVTGSGKSEVYLAASDYYLKQGKTILMLVPEISLTPMMIEYFSSRFKNDVAILHSELTPAEKYDEYRKIAKGEAKIVVGVRSAIFAPLSNIGLIILDEEHVESYKQDNLPYYHARDIAILRSKYHHAKVILGSATPSLESRARAQNNVYHLLKLNKRINNTELPKTTIVNLLDYQNIDRESAIFSKQLRRAISERLRRKEQVILLINRRGFSTNVNCRKCGHVFKCPTCGIPLAYHKIDNMLKCHHCDYVEILPEECPECGSKYLMKTGFGTERIEEEVNRLFPEASTLRLDSDSAKIRMKIPKIVEAFRKKEADILIGTQMIAKGHDFPDVTLVGIVLADIGLSMPSFRSSERAFELITQAVGRSGRSDKEGEAIIQTYLPYHYAITLAARQDYELFYRREMALRKEQNYPPYSYLASIIVSGKNENQVIENTYDAVDYLNHEISDICQILGPTVPFIPKQNDMYIRNILLKYKKIDEVKKVLKKLLNIFMSKRNVNIEINIDPYNF